MGIPQTQRIQELESSFEVFNRVSERLEASYLRLEDRVTQLHGELVANVALDESQPAPQENHPESQYLRAILTALPAGIVVLDGSGRIQECNPAACELLGESLLGDVWSTVITRAFAPRSDDGHEISLKDGRRVSISTCPLGSEPGQVLLITDVTETRELQDNLSQHQRLMAMGEMAAGLAHQIRTPLASSLLFVSQLKNANLDAKNRANVAEKVMEQLRQLESLIADMLMFSRSGYGGDEEISVEAVLSELASSVSAICDQRNIKVLISHDGPTHLIQGNSRILSSALLNLVTNAIQAIGQEGTLHLHAHDGVSNTVEVCVIDDGAGIS